MFMVKFKRPTDVQRCNRGDIWLRGVRFAVGARNPLSREHKRIETPLKQRKSWTRTWYVLPNPADVLGPNVNEVCSRPPRTANETLGKCWCPSEQCERKNGIACCCLVTISRIALGE